METYQLASFLAVARTGSITAAAQELCLTQPAVTQHLQSLEREIGCPLFERTGRGMRPTDAGLAFLPYVRRSAAQIEEGRQVVAEMTGGRGGRLVLGAGVTTSIFSLPQWLRQVQDRCPAVDVVVRTGRSREIAALCLERQIDIGVVTSSVASAQLRQTPVLEDEIVLTLPPDTPAEDRLITLERLRDLPLILFPPATGFRDYLDKALGSAGIVLRIKMESDSAEAIKSFVAMGLGASFLPATAIAAEIANGTLVPAVTPDLPPLRRTTTVITRSDRYLTAAARTFLEIVRVSPHGRDLSSRP